MNREDLQKCIEALDDSITHNRFLADNNYGGIAAQWRKKQRKLEIALSILQAEKERAGEKRMDTKNLEQLAREWAVANNKNLGPDRWEYNRTIAVMAAFAQYVLSLAQPIAVTSSREERAGDTAESGTAIPITDAPKPPLK